MPPLSTWILALVLVFCLWAYMKIAVRFGIIDKPNDRSSHTNPTIRGGGIIFTIAIILFFTFYGFKYPFFFIGLMLVAGISFLDDMYTLSSIYRLGIQFIAVALTLYNIVFWDETLLMYIGILVFATGLLNIYNFMDGINGITGLYSIAIFLPLLYLNTIDAFVDNQLLILGLISILIFGFYNFRRSAKCFAGDVGSISIGLTLIFCVGLLIYTKQDLRYILFFLIYLVDGGFTILKRIANRENIFSPHRSHLYQVLVDHKKYSHLKVSFAYFLVQLGINCLVVLTQNLYILLAGVIVISVIYIGVKKSILSKSTSITA